MGKLRQIFNFRKRSLALSIIFACCCEIHEGNGIETSAMSSTAVIPTANPISLMIGNGRRVPKQVGLVGGAMTNGKDNQQAGTHYGHDHGNHGFTGGHDHGHGHGHHHHHHGMDNHHHGDGKYFQYAHNPHYGEYEYGYRRGNDYHFQERYEKGKGWTFKTKVKWGDKHNGYGEMYWDYNHADSGWNNDGHGHGHGHSDGSEPVPAYEAQSSDKKSSLIAKRENRERMLKLKDDQNNGQVYNHDSKRIGGRIEDNQASPNRRNYRQSQIPRPMITPQAQSHSVPSLMLDPKSGQVIDEVTGKTYWLHPAKPVSSYLI